MHRRYFLATLFLVGISFVVPACAAPKKPIQVALMVFDGVELLDFAGPAEVFIVANRGRAFRVYTVSDRKRTIRTMGRVGIEAEFSYQDAPQPDVIVVPGGNRSGVSLDGRKWLKTKAQDAEIVMSVCFGALVLADAKMLDGIEATSHSWALDSLKKAAPKCKVVSDRRFVDSGKIITTGGVTAGIDGAIHVVERLLGKKEAEWTAKEWMEHRTPK